MLQTARLILRPQEAADAPAFFRILSDPEAMRFWNRPPVTRLEVVAGLLAEQQEAMARGLCRYWTVMESGDAIGGVDLSLIGDGAAELGFLLRRDRWGFGFATEAVVGIVEEALGPMDLKRLAAAAHADNSAARRVLEKTGFALVEVRSAKLADGSLADCAFYRRDR